MEHLSTGKLTSLIIAVQLNKNIFRYSKLCEDESIYNNLRLEVFLARDPVNGFYDSFTYKHEVQIPLRDGRSQIISIGPNIAKTSNIFDHIITNMRHIQDMIVDGVLTLNMNLVVLEHDLTHNLFVEPDQKQLMSNAIKNFGNLLESGLLSDVSIIVEGGKEFKVHKAILSSRSEFFRNCFDKDDVKPKYECLKLDAITFGYFLKFLYTGEFKPSEVDLKKLLELADKFKVQELKDLCNILLEQIPDAHVKVFKNVSSNIENLKI